jgi:hypothetical protein
LGTRLGLNGGHRGESVANGELILRRVPSGLHFPALS